MKTTSLRLLCVHICVLIAVSFADCVSAQATEASDSIIQLNEVTVSAAPPCKLATVQELAGPELQALSTTSIADALKYFAGVQIKD